MRVYSNGQHSGDIQYESIPAGVELARETGGRHIFNVGVKKHRVSGAKIGKVLLGVKVSSREPLRQGLKWRITFNGIVVSRLFKPVEEVRLGNRWFGYEVYDATPVVSGRFRNRIQRVGVSYPGGYDITIEDVELFVNIETDNSIAYGIHEYRSGIHKLEPGQSISFKRISGSVPASDYDFVSTERLLLFLPNRRSKFTIISGETMRTVTGRTGLVDITLHNVTQEDKSVIVFEGPKDVYPREGAVLSYFSVRQYYSGPKIIVQNASCDCVKREVTVNVANKGKKEPESMQVILLKAGMLIKRFNLKPLKPGEQRELTIKKVDVIDEESPLKVRILWNWLSRNEYVELDIPTQ